LKNQHIGMALDVRLWCGNFKIEKVSISQVLQYYLMAFLPWMWLNWQYSFSSKSQKVMICGLNWPLRSDLN